MWKLYLHETTKWFLLLIGLITLDLLSKYLVFYNGFELGNNWLGIQLFKNYNAFFSFPLSNNWVIGINLIVLGFLLKSTPKIIVKHNERELFARLLIIAGGISNILDRFFLGYARDFIAILTGFYNLADVYILMGIIYWLWIIKYKDVSLYA